MEILKTIFRISLVLLTFGACSSSAPGTFVSDPSEVKTEFIPQELNFEVKILDQAGQVVPYLDVSLDTKTFHDEGVTNVDGIVTLVAQRSQGEPLTFRFRGKDLFAAETVSQLPTSLNSPIIVFEIVSPHKVRLSHYSVDGLYR